jgi:hypothetical protein
MSLLNEILEKSKLTKELIGIWKYGDSESFWCGHVIDFNETLVKLQHFTKYGKPDGIIIVPVHEIQSVDFNDDYTKAMQCLIDYSAELDKQNKLDLTISENENWHYGILKQLEGNSEVMANIEFNQNSDSFSGFIQKVSEDDFVFHCIGEMGEDEGMVIYKVDDINTIKINDMVCRKRMMLHKWRKASL